MFFMHLMVFIIFDKIHRLIRDLKKAENGCCQKIWTKSKLWSAYLLVVHKQEALWIWGKRHTEAALAGGVCGPV